MEGSILFNDKRYYTLQKAAEFAGVDARKLESLYLARILPGQLIGGALYIEADALMSARAAESAHEVAQARPEAREAPMPTMTAAVHEEPQILAETVVRRPQQQRAAARGIRVSSVLTTLAAIAVVAVIPVAAAMAYPTMQRGVAALRTEGPGAMTSIHLPQFGSIGSFFAGMRSQLASVFVLGEATPTGDVATSAPPLSASKVLAQNALNTFGSTTTASTSTPSTSVQPIYYVYNYPVIERIKYEAPGISASSTSDYDTKLQELYNKIEQQILVLSQTSSTQNAQTYQVIAQTNRIDQLASVHVSSSNISGGTITGASISGGSYSGTVDASSLNAGSSTLATTTINGDLNLTGSLNFSGSSSTISATAAVLNNATTTNLFSTLAHFTTGIIDTLTATAANITGLTATNSTTTNATSTNLFATNLSASTASTTNLIFTNATGSTMYLSGNATVGGNLTVNGNSITLGTSTANSLVINSSIQSNLIPDQNITRDLGSASFYWRNAYVGTLTANNISAASTSIGGTASNDFTINSDNLTADAETMNLIFFRGTVVPNALLTWNSAANKKRFEFNQAVAISNASASTTNPTFTLTGTAGQSANILQVASSSGSNIFTVGPNGDTAVSGNLTVGGTTNITGALSLVNASTSLLSVFQKAYFGGTATSTFDSTGALTLATPGANSLLYTNGASQVAAVTVGSATGLSFSSGTLSLSSIPNSSLTNSTISGVALGGSLASLTATDGTLTFTGAYNGSAARTVGLNLANANSWTGLQNYANASTSQLSVFQRGYFGGSATSTFDNAGNLALVLNGLTIGTNQLVAAGGNVGVGTTSPFRKLSVTDTVSAAQLAVAYDGTRYTQLQTDAAGDFHLNPSGQDAQLDDSNFWICSGGSCPAGTPTGTGNAVVEGKVGIGTSSPASLLDVYGSTGGGGGQINISTDSSAGTRLRFVNSSSVTNWQIASQQNVANAFEITPSTAVGGTTFTTPAVTVLSSGNVGVGTTSPSKQLSVQSLIYVGANGATGLGTATSTFQGDIKITGKLDVGTIDPPYTIDGVKYATYGASTVGVHEEVVLKVTPTTYDAKRKLYDYAIDFSSLQKGSDAWLFYQVTDFGPAWENLVVTLTPGFDGRAFYEQDPAHHTLHILSDKEGSVSVRLIANRYDFTKWGNLRPDQDGVTEGTHVISSKPSTPQAAAAAAVQ